MKWQVKEFARLTGVSIRTLHYYDQIGLLKPSSVDPGSGYRFYNEDSLCRMQQILFYRELDFPLKTITQILSAPDYDMQSALAAQRHLLVLKKQRLERIIDAIDSAWKGMIPMDTFSHKEYETARSQYEAEVKERWGQTEAYRTYAQKAAVTQTDAYAQAAAQMGVIFAEFASCRKTGTAPESPEAQALVKKLQDHISTNYYPCTRQILSGLGQMYVADPRFRQTIDSAGAGTAEYVSAAIEGYCRAKD